ncbi:Fibroblast growth factor receptor 3 [Acropora cervicornis]|uniref:receptor protein-tyrosine kinase n=1 Tax=Acropora cervicornis TaxID=6130 RepID=A0AAD9QDW7_ACRCE|nr:Fibroblast growth factor receptor 3 [Acropora cervicornis]
MGKRRIVQSAWIFMNVFILKVIAQPDGPEGTNNTHTPRISKKNLLNISITQNSLATFSCKQEILGAGLAGLQFDWIKWSNDISLYCSLDLDNGNFTVIDENSKFSIKPSAPDDIGNHWSYLLIHNATVHDSGLYSCVVCNQHGRDFSSAFLTVTTPSTPARAFTGSSSPSSSHHSPSFLSAKIILGSIGGIVAVILVAIAFLVWKRRRSKDQSLLMILTWKKAINDENISEHSIQVKQQTVELTGETVAVSQGDILAPQAQKRHSSYRSQLSSAGSLGTVITYADDLLDIPLDENWEVPRDSIDIKELAGEGAFGYVAKAKAFQLPNKVSTPCIVAVKMLKENASDVELADFISEMEMMKEIGSHKNIVNYLGACTVHGPLFLIVEYCSHGNLKDFLRNNRPSLLELSGDMEVSLTFRDLLSFAYQITKGMSYLSSKKCIHRDLAARNVLIAEDFVIKIADFGLSRNLGNTDYYRRTTHVVLWNSFVGDIHTWWFTLSWNSCRAVIFFVKDWISHGMSYKLSNRNEYVAILAQSVDCLAEPEAESEEPCPRTKQQTNRINTTI